MKILVVDDDRAARTGLRRILEGVEGADYEIIEADDGPTALYKMAAERPDLVLLDLHLGAGIDGFEVARRAPPEIQIIIVTGDEPHEVRRQALEHMQATIGRLVIVTKPPNIPELLALVATSRR